MAVSTEQREYGLIEGKIIDMTEYNMAKKNLILLLLEEEWHSKSNWVRRSAIKLDLAGVPKQEISSRLYQITEGKISKQLIRKICSKMGYTRHYVNDNEKPNLSKQWADGQKAMKDSAISAIA
jgi:hypothetical protein